MELSLSRAGADSMITPREMLRDYMTVLNILMQNDTVTFDRVVGGAFGGTEAASAADATEEKGRAVYSAEDIEF